MGGRRRVLSAAGARVAIVALVFIALPHAASAQDIQTDTKLVTIAARSCPDYTSIFANRARNNIMESLKDLGPDTEYAEGEALTNEKETNPPQDACEPITDWRFTLGKGYQSRAVTGPWGSLSKATSPFGTSIVTKASTPLLNDQGQDTGGDIAGAVTITLTEEQAQLAGTGNTLWIQGGTPTDPVLNTAYPGQYGFGALRCAIDNLNGDNVEWIAYPTGARHVFCYAYYVKPPPTSGTIVVKKQVLDAPPGTPSQSFPFAGNISYNEGGRFSLTAALGHPSSTTFFRAGGSSWNFTEDVPGGWQLTAIDCVSQKNTSTFTTDTTTGRTDVALASGDKVTCTYTDRYPPPVAGLTLRKITRGGTGTFGFAVDPKAGGDASSASATTSVPGVAVDAAPVLDALVPGDYDVREKLPDSDRGAWALTGVTCNDRDRGTDNPVSVTLAAGTGTVCTFENRFTPKGTIRLHKETRAGTGTFGFVINSVGTTPPRRYVQRATTTAENRSVRASGDDTGNLPLGVYEITETASASATTAWRVNGAICNGKAVPVAQGAIRIALTEADPDLDCTFFNELQKPAVLPSTATGGGRQSTPRADLVLHKRPGRRVIRLGQTVRYLVTVRNRGRATARNVVVVEQVGDPKALLSATPKRYRCQRKLRLSPGCVIGTLRPGQTARIVVLVRSRFTGRRPNRAVVSTSTAELNRRNNVARSAVFVRPRPHFTG
jgi:uncharacterized repeat protein (TIGR01451 family)